MGVALTGCCLGGEHRIGGHGRRSRSHALPVWASSRLGSRLGWKPECATARASSICLFSQPPKSFSRRPPLQIPIADVMRHASYIPSRRYPPLRSVATWKVSALRRAVHTPKSRLTEPKVDKSSRTSSVSSLLVSCTDSACRNSATQEPRSPKQPLNDPSFPPDRSSLQTSPFVCSGWPATPSPREPIAARVFDVSS